MPALVESFEEFLRRCESVHSTTSTATATAMRVRHFDIARSGDFSPPSGERMVGAKSVNDANGKGAASFKEGIAPTPAIRQSWDSDPVSSPKC